MFPEYRELISKLKTTDLHFKHLFDQHNDLDQQIRNLEGNVDHIHARSEEIAELKKNKLLLKSQIWALLLKADPSAH